MYRNNKHNCCWRHFFKGAQPPLWVVQLLQECLSQTAHSCDAGAAVVEGPGFRDLAPRAGVSLTPQNPSFAHFFNIIITLIKTYTPAFSSSYRKNYRTPCVLKEGAVLAAPQLSYAEL